MASIRFVNVSKTYAGTDQPSLFGVSQQIEHGEFFVLVGPSGCGKSTLLKLIAGLEHPSDGELYLDDTLVNWVEPGDRNVALVFQSYALYPNMSVEQNVRFPLKMRKVRGARADAQVAAALRPLGLEPLARRRVGQLSGGERQRVALARAIVREPSVTLMDEPLSNLDAKLRSQTRDELLRLHQRVPGTVVYVTHDQTEAMTMADRMAVMDKGHIVQVGTPVEVYTRPQTKFVAQFLGSPAMNVLPGRLERHAGGVAFAGALTVELPERLARAVAGAEGETYELGVRADVLGLRPAGDGDGEGWTIELVEYLGTEYLVAAAREGQTVKARVPVEQRPAPGERVALTADPDALYLFDAEGRNVEQLAAAPSAPSAPDSRSLA
jgi:ABC-type sugar transport system ATPase subunit